MRFDKRELTIVIIFLIVITIFVMFIGIHQSRQYLENTWTFIKSITNNINSLSSSSNNKLDVRIPGEMIKTRSGNSALCHMTSEAQFNVIDYVNPFEATFE